MSIGSSLLRLRSDDQLVALFRAGNDDAFRAIHDRYRQRLFAYTRQMLPGRQDAEDAVQDVFVRAYSGLRANDRELALRAWLYRVAHNRCVDELRRAVVPPAEAFELLGSPVQDPVAQADQRESLRRLIADVRRLPDQQRSALLMRELSGLSYAELAGALGVSIPAVKSLLVRARMALARALEARDAACTEIRDELVLAHDRRVRPNAMARRHMRDCAGCRDFRRDMRGVSRQLAALVPALGPVSVIAKVLGCGVGGGAGGSAAAGGGTAAVGLGAGGAFASAGAAATGAAGHVATLIVATVVTAGGAVEIQHTISAPVHHHHQARAAVARRPPNARPPAPAASVGFSIAPTAQPAPAVLKAAVVRADATSPAPAPPPVVTHKRVKPPTPRPVSTPGSADPSTEPPPTGPTAGSPGTGDSSSTADVVPGASTLTASPNDPASGTASGSSTATTAGAVPGGGTTSSSTSPSTPSTTSSTGSGSTATGTGSSGAPAGAGGPPAPSNP